MKSGVSLRQKFPIVGLKWLPYCLGWIFGVGNLVFWWILLIVGLIQKDRHKFIDRTIHEVIFIYGLVCIGLILVAVILSALYIWIVLN